MFFIIPRHHFPKDLTCQDTDKTINGRHFTASCLVAMFVSFPSQTQLLHKVLLQLESGFFTEILGMYPCITVG